MKSRSTKKAGSTADNNQRRRGCPFFVRLFAATLALTVLQFGTFLAMLFVSGEFSHIKKYAYDSVSEKTENRKNYVENTLANKMPLVYEAGREINDITERALRSNNADYGDIKTDKALCKQILHDSVDTISSMLHRGLVNDAYIVLDTGSLYESGPKGDDTSDTLATVYLRDVNVTDGFASERENVFLEAGSADIASEFDVMLDSAWTSHLQLSGGEKGSFEFYYKTLRTARENPKTDMADLGCWTGFSAISETGRESMRYTVPLVADSGEVYGVIGIGLMEKTVLSYIPGNDLPNERSCYILGVDMDNDGVYVPQLNSGAIYKRVVGSGTVISREHSIGKNVYDFNTKSTVSVPTVGTIKDVNIYNADSPYKYNKWAIISISEKAEALSIYSTLVHLFTVSFVISAAISILCTIFMNHHLTAPVRKISRTLEQNRDSDEIINFESSGITEIDSLTDEIKQLQINVKEQSSRVSKIISMAVVGIGAFMYDTVKQTVFISESMISTLSCDKLPGCGDRTIPYSEFSRLMAEIDYNNDTNIAKLFADVYSGDDGVIISRQYPLTTDAGEKKWFSLSLRRDGANILGLVQDVTQSVMEMQKVKYERDYDVTTGLLNRRAYQHTIEKMFREPKKLKTAAFLMFDIDDLKYVNDTYGHDFGDDYIAATANVLKNFHYHGGVVARMSGDEFNVFLSGFDTKEEIRRIVAEVMQKLGESYCILSDGTHYKLRASGGIAWYPDDSTSYEMLIRFADFAMYTIKHSTNGSIAEFDITKYTKDSILITGVEEMNRIIDTESIKYALHAIISVRTGRIYGYEALMRPQSEVFKAPLDFIRIAKTSAKLYEIERLTWKLALRTFHEYIKEGMVPQGAKIFINSISNCIMDAKDIAEIERENKDILNSIVLEVLESEEANSEYVHAKQEWISRIGAMTALDDFGSGYNSEYALLTLKPDIIKIDRSIISGCDRDEGKADIITKLVQIAATKNTLVLAEGVETREELKKVIECGVDLLQGFYFGKPSFEPMKCTEQMTGEILDLCAEAESERANGTI